jgi:diguanylate cyclase (GGDEF)-like protein
MRYQLRTKEALAIILLTFLVVATTTLIHLSQLTRVVIQETSGQAELIAKQIYAQSGRSLSRGGKPQETLRSDPELRSLLDASVGYSPYLLYALIADQRGRTILHSEQEKEGVDTPARPSLRQLLSLNPVRRFQGLYQEGIIYEATLPLNLNGKPFGSIRLGIPTSLLRRELNAALKQILTVAGIALTTAWLVAIGLANRMLTALRATSLVDELTGLYNRRGFLFLAEQQVKIADRMKTGMLLLFADLDQLKRINDTHGHREGDRALMETANILKGTFRGADIIARIGGDEFAILTVEARNDSGGILTTRLQENLDARNAAASRGYTLSVSVGIARYNADEPYSILELLDRADALMYKQKQARQALSATAGVQGPAT